MSSNITETKTDILSLVSDNSDAIRDLSENELEQLTKELREFTINSVAKTGGHLGAGLGVIELTVALHHVFKAPEDKLIWDIGHQAYPHKILTGRKDQMHKLRQAGGISGFLSRKESKYDHFGAGHSSTSISAALGMAVARDLQGKSNEVIAIIGDGSISAGMAYEAMNNAGASKSRLIVILNDNDMSIAPPVGAMSKYLSKILCSDGYLKMRHKVKKMLKFMPDFCSGLAKTTEKCAKSFANQDNLFEDLGFKYFGPMNGHDLKNITKTLVSIRDNKNISGPILLHLKTEKGHGFNSPDSAKEKFHAVGKFDSETLTQFKNSSKKQTYTNMFSQTMLEIAKQDEKIFAITAAMPSGTGLSEFAQQFPKRFVDVGIAEQHAVTFAAGLACENVKPFVAIYSTFMQRAYDQLIHDVAIQNLPVRFILDRAGYVGADGATHAGSFDLASIAAIPNLTIMAPSDENELRNMLHLMKDLNDGPSMVRYPRGEALGVALDDVPTKVEIGKGRVVKFGKKALIISIGTRLSECLIAAENLEKQHGISPTIIDARFVKPLDESLISQFVESHDVILTVEEGSIGGFGSHVSNLLTENNLLISKKFKSLFYPDEFFEHDTQENLHARAGMNASSIIQEILSMA